MIVVMHAHSTLQQVEAVEQRLCGWGFDIHRSQGVERTVIGAVGDRREWRMQALEAMDGVERVIPILRPYKLAAREAKPGRTVVAAGQAAFGSEKVVLIAGPCAVESDEQIIATARAVKASGATVLRGGAFKPRTSPYSFQGLEERGLALLALAKKETGLALITEVVDQRDMEMVARHADIVQIGARNMQNFALLHEAGRTGKPVMIKRGFSATVEEWLMAAEHVLVAGNEQIILCERGIRTFETGTRNTLDISAIAQVRRLSHLPVVADPSHGTGKRNLVLPLSLAAVAAGADGLMVEVHPNPSEALSDGPQSLQPDEFADLARRVAAVARAIGRDV